MSNPALSDLSELRDWLRGQIDGYEESRGHDERISGYIDVVERAMDAERKLEAAQRNAKRYIKLRKWMSSNVKEGWAEIEKLAAIACYTSWEDFDTALDSLHECNVGLCETAIDAALGKP